MKGLRRAENVLAIVDSLRERHPELGQPLNWNGLMRVFARERVTLLKMPLIGGAAADVVGFPPYFVVTINSSSGPRRQTRDAAHEYGHIKLHPSEIGEIDRNLSPIRSDDPRELEAQLFAQLLMVGPTATPDHPKIAPLVAALVAHRHRARMPEQLPLPLPSRPKEETSPSVDRRDIEKAYEDDLTWWRRHLRVKRAGRVKIFRDEPDRSDDGERIKFYDEKMRACRFTDRDGRFWWIYNFAVVTVSGVRRRKRVRDFMSKDIEFRVFLNSLGVKMVYRFANRREHRAYKVKHLDRQISQARAVASNSTLLREVSHARNVSNTRHPEGSK